MRVVVPSKHQLSIVDELHVGHMGVVKMKGLARSHVWWPTIDKDIEGVTCAYSGCQLMRNDPKLTPVHPVAEYTLTLQVLLKVKCSWWWWMHTRNGRR